jgi:predicted phage tail protein
MSALAPNASEATAGGVSSVVLGVIFMVGIPLFYGILGFIAGAIGALIYNGAAGIMGGVKLELEGVHQEYAPPPPPNNWAPHQYPAR